ncbi:MAG: response regulator [Bacteriovoracaceae bacterium]|nr:response regulator [Bacteriovoracaceae bacterium]
MDKIKIFLIDDIDDVLEVMKMQLHRVLNCEVKSFNNHQKVLDALNSGEMPDLFFSDINMPDGHGETWGNALKEQGIHVPFIYYTGYDEDEIGGNSDSTILSKPIEDDHLIHIITETLKNIK